MLKKVAIWIGIGFACLMVLFVLRTMQVDQQNVEFREQTAVDQKRYESVYRALKQRQPSTLAEATSIIGKQSDGCTFDPRQDIYACDWYFHAVGMPNGNKITMYADSDKPSASVTEMRLY